MDRINRFARNQAVNNTGMLLYQLASACMDYLEWELYGTSYKHGLDNAPIRNENRPALASLAIELLQEIGVTKEELEQAWNDAQKNREELEEITKERDSHDKRD
jgi:hypothetical protein